MFLAWLSSRFYPFSFPFSLMCCLSFSFWLVLFCFPSSFSFNLFFAWLSRCLWLFQSADSWCQVESHQLSEFFEFRLWPDSVCNMMGCTEGRTIKNLARYEEWIMSESMNDGGREEETTFAPFLILAMFVYRACEHCAAFSTQLFTFASLSHVSCSSPCFRSFVLFLLLSLLLFLFFFCNIDCLKCLLLFFFRKRWWTTMLYMF